MTTPPQTDPDDISDAPQVDEVTEVPDSVQGGVSGGQFSKWPIGTDLAGYLAEAAVADYFFKDDKQTVWRGGNHRGVDIYADFPEGMSEALRFSNRGQELAQTKVDVKHSYENEFVLDGLKQTVVSFFGADREVQVREGVSHYALVVFNLTDDLTKANQVEVSSGAEVRVTASYHLRRMYMIPADDVNRIFRKRENKKGEPSGLEQCASLEEIAEFLVAGTAWSREM